MNFRKFLFLFLTSVAIVNADIVREEILVAVNGHIVTYKAFQEETVLICNQITGGCNEDNLFIAKKNAIQNLIDYYIVLDEAGLNSNSLLDITKQEGGFASDADLEKHLMTSMGLDIKAFLQRNRKALITKAIAYINPMLISKILVNDVELYSYYNSHKNEYCKPCVFHVCELVLSKRIAENNKKDISTILNSIQEKLKLGVTFESLARDYSISPSCSAGGDLGWLEASMLHSSLSLYIKNLSKGQITDPIEIDDKVFLVQLVEKECGNLKSFLEVRDSIFEKISEIKSKKIIENYIELLRNKAHIRYIVSKDELLRGDK